MAKLGTTKTRVSLNMIDMHRGCIVRTTAEFLLALLPEWEFAREPDALTGYDELVVRAVSE